MKSKILIIIFSLSLKVFGVTITTPQIPDKLIYNGKEYEWKGISPAYEYFEKNNLKPPNEALKTTANYGVFLFTYSIIENKLYLTDVEILVNKRVKHGNKYLTELGDKSIFKEFFPNSDKILMKKHSNIQLITYGETISITKNGWTDIHYEDYLVFEIKNGIINKEYDLSYRKFKKLVNKQFKKFKQTEKYLQVTKSKKNELDEFNYFRPNKYSMDEYLKTIIFSLIDKLY